MADTIFTYKGRIPVYGGWNYIPYFDSFRGPFDSYTFTAGYSLRRLKANYTGDAIVVKRSSDNATQSIGFDVNGDLDQSSLTTFVGANDGYIETWFDQSGNGYHATLGTYSANGPQIVVSGVVATMSNSYVSRPTTKWASADGKTVLRNASFSQTMPATNFAMARLTSTTLTSRAPIVYDSSDISNARHLLYNSGKVDAPNDNWGMVGASAIYNSSSFNTNPKLLTAKFNGASSTLRADSLQILSGNAGSATHTGLKIGNLRNAFGTAPLANKYEWYGDISELIFFQSDQSTNYNYIENNIRNYHYIQTISPSDIAGLNTWLIAGVGVTNDTGGVSNWADQSGNGNHAFQNTSGIRPTDNGDRITFALNDILNTTKAVDCGTLFIVMNQGSANYGSMLGGITKHGIVRQATAQEFYGAETGSSHLFFGPPRYNGVTASIASNPAGDLCYYNGLSNSAVRQYTWQSTAAVVNVTLRFGDGDDIGGAPTTGDVYEVIMYDTKLSYYQILQIESYLMSKYSVS